MESPTGLSVTMGHVYNSREFKQFAESWGFQHVTWSPHYPQSNGLAEKTVQTAKRILTKAKEDKKDPYHPAYNNATTPTPGGSLSFCSCEQGELSAAPEAALRQIHQADVGTTYWRTHSFPAGRWHLETSDSHPTS